MRRRRLFVSPVGSCGCDKGGEFFNEVVTLLLLMLLLAWLNGVVVVSRHNVVVVVGCGAAAAVPASLFVNCQRARYSTGITAS